MKDQASVTARFVAEHIVLLGPGEHARLEVPAEQIEWTVRCLETCGWSRAALTSRRWRWISSLVERFSIPGVRAHYVLRKRIIEREARRAIAEGFRQIVVIAAGLDVLAVRLAEEFPELRFIELDHPATQRVKIETLQRWGCPPNLTLLPIDLRTDGVVVPVGRTLFIAEGVLMYLGEEEVGKLLRSLRGRGIFTATESIHGFRGSSPLVAAWLRRKGEPFRWAIAQERVSPFLARHGFNLRQLYGPAEIRALAPGRQVAEGEVIMVADND